MPGMLGRGDLEAIAGATGGDAQSLDWLAEHFVASDGVKILRLMETGDVAIVEVPTISPALRDGECVFLTDDGRCDIHEVAPFGCSHFDTHMDGDQADERTRAMIADLVDGEMRGAEFRASGPLGYFERHQALRVMGRDAGPVAGRREKYRKALAEAERESQING